MLRGPVRDRRERSITRWSFHRKRRNGEKIAYVIALSHDLDRLKFQHGDDIKPGRRLICVVARRGQATGALRPAIPRPLREVLLARLSDADKALITAFLLGAADV